MKRKSLVVLTLLVVAALMAGVGTGALDVFSAERSAVMEIVNDDVALISILGDGLYTEQTNRGLKLDFTGTSQGGEGINVNAVSVFHEVFKITNKSEKTVFVWLESPAWHEQIQKNVVYRVANPDAKMTEDTTYTAAPKNKLLWTSGTNFTGGVGDLAYVRLEPGEFFDVNIEVRTLGSYAVNYPDWSHTIKVMANTNAPTRP